MKVYELRGEMHPASALHATDCVARCIRHRRFTRGATWRGALTLHDDPRRVWMSMDSRRLAKGYVERRPDELSLELPHRLETCRPTTAGREGEMDDYKKYYERFDTTDILYEM
eukprot:13824169-Heterocapsa_arctica.AAC.1